MSLLVLGVAKLNPELESETAVAMVFELVGAKWAAVIVFIGGFLGITTAGYGPFLNQTRIMASIS